jgi:hypothetical protein
MFDIFTKLREYQEKEVERLMKGDADQVPDTASQSNSGNDIGRKAIIDDPFYYDNATATIYKPRASRLTNRMLKDVSLRDWLVSSIIQNRVDTLAQFSRPQKKKFDMGYRVLKKDDPYCEYTEEERNEIQNIEDFIYHCGRKDGTPISDRMTFSEYVKLSVRDLLTFGHLSTEKILTRSGGLHRFRPVPAEQTYLINKSVGRKQIEDQLNSMKPMLAPKSDNDPNSDVTINHSDIDKYKYVQVSYDGNPIAVFGDGDMIFKLFNPQNFADSFGYCYGLLELAIVNITNHLNTENYNSQFFTHGYAAKGVLHLKGTVTQSQLTAFRRQFYNSITGTANAWRTPIIAGLDDIQWIPMSGSARDMEYISYNSNIMRSICTQFQIDPIELGLDFLTSSTGRSGPSTQEGNTQKVEFSRERGLIPIMMFLEDMINSEIIPAIDPEFGKKYVFRFDGYTDITPQTEVALLQAEMTVHKSMNDLLSVARKDKINELVANLPMNQAFWALVEKNMTRGEIREKFFGDVDASKRRELQYIPGDAAFMGWQQLLVTMDMQKEQKEMQKEQMEQQKQQAEAQQQQEQQDQALAQREHEHKEAKHQRDQQSHDMEVKAQQDAAALNAVKHGESNLHDTAKQVGASSKPIRVGGQVIKNPLNMGQ